MPLTLREALTTVEPLRQSRVVAGERGLDNIVQFVNVMEVPDILDWVHPGGLLVTTMYPLRDDVAEIEQLIPRLLAKGLAGLAVNPHAYLAQFPQSMLDAANTLGFPLVELPDKVSFIDIIQPVLTCELAHRQDDTIICPEEKVGRPSNLTLSNYSPSPRAVSQETHRARSTRVDRVLDIKLNRTTCLECGGAKVSQR